MGYKIIYKAAITNYIEKYEGSLYIETYHASKSTHYLKVNTINGPQTLGRVSKAIFTWFNLEQTEEQPAFINVSWFKFVKRDK